MASGALRLQKELKAFVSSPAPYTSFHELRNENLNEWVVYIYGPEGTAYEGTSCSSAVWSRSP